MNSNLIYIILWILFPIVLFSLLLGYRYFKSKENMALIEKGKDLSKNEINKDSLIIWASIFIGISIGIIIGFLSMKLFHVNADLISVTILVTSIFLCLGIALLICYYYINKFNYK